jgi:cysteinyl-tRNA synthetase
VEQAMNLTDVDDKIIRRASERGQTIREVTEPVVATFHRDREYLRIEAAEHYPRATEFIPEMIALVERLLANEVAYLAEDGSIYFAIGRFPAYGRLSRLDTREIKSGARVAQDDYTKENAQDFALWKAAKEEDERAGAAWDSPWGRARPGWHLECSAMAMALLARRSTCTAAASTSCSRTMRTRSRRARRRRGGRSAASGAMASSCSPTGRRWRSASATCRTCRTSARRA